MPGIPAEAISGFNAALETAVMILGGAREPTVELRCRFVAISAIFTISLVVALAWSTLIPSSFLLLNDVFLLRAYLTLGLSNSSLLPEILGTDDCDDCIISKLSSTATLIALLPALILLLYDRW
jgi:hypothetical protein